MGDGADMCHDAMDQEIAEHVGDIDWWDEREANADANQRQLDEIFKPNKLRSQMPF